MKPRPSNYTLANIRAMGYSLLPLSMVSEQDLIAMETGYKYNHAHRHEMIVFDHMDTHTLQCT